MKKLLCLLLALLMVFSLAACGGESDNGDDDHGSAGGKNEDPTESTAPEDDTVWVLVKESDMGSSRYKKYIYDENGNLIGGKFYKDNKVWGEYQYVTTETASGGKLVEEFSKGAAEDEYTKYNEYEFDAQGRLISTTDYDYQGNASGYVYTFTYNEAGQLIEQVGAKDGVMDEKCTWVYDGDKLMESHYENQYGNYGHYLYSYDEEGKPVKVDTHTYSMDYESEYTLDFEVVDSYYFELSATEECHYVVGGSRLFYYEKTDELMYVQAKSWGIFCTGWLPNVALGAITPSNYFIGSVNLEFQPLEVHLAQQADQ